MSFIDLIGPDLFSISPDLKINSQIIILYREKNNLVQTKENPSDIKACFLLLDLVSDTIRLGIAIELSDSGKEGVT